MAEQNYSIKLTRREANLVHEALIDMRAKMRRELDRQGSNAVGSQIETWDILDALVRRIG